MPRVAPGKRKRAYRPKTKTGCLTCKKLICLLFLVRRVKCDEALPHCLRCTSTGRKCDGYPDVEELSSASSRGSSVDLWISSSPALVRVPSPSFLETSQERRAFHYFINATAPMMAGFATERCWSEFLPRAAHYERPIRHALVALGALHESRTMVSRGVKLDSSLLEFPLQEYGRAIRSLVEPFLKKERQSMDVCLLSCVLFAAFEMMQGNFGSGVAHQQSGNKILSEIIFNESTGEYQHDTLSISNTPYIPMKTIEELYLRTDFALSQMVTTQDSTIFDKFENTRLSLELPETFTSLAEARNTLQFLWTRFRCLLNNLESHATSPELPQLFLAWQQETLEKTNQWNLAFQAFISKYGHTFTEHEKVGVLVLEIQYQTGHMNAVISRAVADDQMAWDPCLSSFEKLIELATKVLDSPAFTAAEFQIDVGIIGPLYHTSACCRHPVVRRKAIELLERVPTLQEGVWNAGITARAARRVVEIEEFGLGVVKEAADVPDWARISEVDPTFDMEKNMVTIKYYRSGKAALESVREPITETFEW
ncbi:C6 zinc finger domain protein [Rutstroemia sp. NJR-2017a BVV2]|nr:C6 zinc finger domain protein [Rutstroemia sp. NJR-2017a BVV2]